MALLEGLSEEVLQTVAENLPITKGAHRLMKALKYYGYKTAILWVYFFWKIPAKKLGIDYVHANELEIIDGKLTGNYLGEIVDGKSRIFTSHCRQGRHSHQSNHCVGDGANDLPMLN
jgi:phosphoserine phosphatase